MNGPPAGSGTRRWSRWLERAAATVVLAFLAGYVARHWAEVAGHAWRIDGGRLVAATACVLVAYSGFVLVWRRILRRLGGHLSLLDAHRIWYIGNLGRYVPGKVFQLAGTAYLARAKGVSPVLTVGASLIAQVFLLAGGLAIAAATLPAIGGGAAALGVSWPVGLAVSGVLLLLVLTPALDAGYRLGLRLIRRSEYYETLPAGEKPILLLADLAAWAVMGTGFWLFVRAVAPIQGSPLALIGICAAGYAGGYLAVFVPGGLGVREGLYALLLGAYVPPSVAVAIAILARLWLTACELIPVALLVARYGLADLRAGAADPDPRPAHG